MERNYQKEQELQNSMPQVRVPAIKIISYGRKIYVQMNVKSFVYVSPQMRDIMYYQGFLFEVKIPTSEDPLSSLKISDTLDTSLDISLKHLINIEIYENQLPTIQLVGDFPILFHPHFRIKDQLGFKQNAKWVEYKKKKEIEKDLGSYLIRIAYSLKYDNGYIDVEASNIGNPEALKWYKWKRQEQPNLFPTDNISLPKTKNFHIKPVSTEQKERRKFDIQSNQSKRSISFQVNNNQSESTLRKLKFEIIESTPPYTPRTKFKSNLDISDELSADYRNRAPRPTTSHEFYLAPTAFKTISEHIRWGETTNDNIVEQGGILLGHAFVDPNTEITYAIAEQAVEGRLARGTAGYLEVTHETWKEMLDHVDNLGTELQIIGWYHTHPNNLDVFMSGTDRNTQELLFNNDWQFAIVLNPHKKIWRSFYGSRSEECKGFVIKNDTENSSTTASDINNGGLGSEHPYSHHRQN